MKKEDIESMIQTIEELANLSYSKKEDHSSFEENLSRLEEDYKTLCGIPQITKKKTKKYLQ